jgi:hypothetical protein
MLRPYSFEKEPRLAAGLENRCSCGAKIKRIGVNVASESIGPGKQPAGYRAAEPLGCPTPAHWAHRHQATVPNSTSTGVGVLTSVLN